MRINYSTVILGLRTNVWTAILVCLAGCVLFVALHRIGQETSTLAARLSAVTADELERQKQSEERSAGERARNDD